MVRVSPCAPALPRVPHPGKRLLPALARALTCHGPGLVYEANCIAGWFLRNHSWASLVGCKISTLVTGSVRLPVAGPPPPDCRT